MDYGWLLHLSSMQNPSSFPLPFSSPAEPQHRDSQTEQRNSGQPVHRLLPLREQQGAKGCSHTSTRVTGTPIRYSQCDTALLAHPPTADSRMSCSAHQQLPEPGFCPTFSKYSLCQSHRERNFGSSTQHSTGRDSTKAQLIEH